MKSAALKAVKVTYLGKPMHQVYPHATGWQVFKFKFFRALRWLFIRFTIAAGLAGIALGAYFYGIFEQGQFIEAKVELPVAAVIPTTAPVLERIAMAESRGSHFCTSDLVKRKMCPSSNLGQVLQHVNTDGTIDTGYYQINSIHGAEATKLGFNLMVEADNKAYAEYLYANYGTEPWYSSKRNW